MDTNVTRRGVLAATAGLCAAGVTSVEGSTTTPPPGDRLNLFQTDSRGVLKATAQSYERRDKEGKIPTDLGYRNQLRVLDVITVVWDQGWGKVKNARDDSARGHMARTHPDVPELVLNNDLHFDDPDPQHPRYNYDYSADLYQRILLSKDRPAVLLDGAIDFEPRGVAGGFHEDFEHTVYTVWNPESGTRKGESVEEASLKSHRGYDVAVAVGEDGEHIAFARRHVPTDGEPNTRFDGQRFGVEATATGEDKSAWSDTYGEADGWIDENERNEGNLDVGVGTYAGTESKVEWTSAFGFGDAWEKAADAAIDAIEAGYESERSAWI